MILARLKRYWRSKGFGVHSPFAFRFITEVLRETLPYYDYARIPGTRQRLVYRLACRFRPAYVRCTDRDDEQAAMMACPAALRCSDARWQLAVVDAADFSDALMHPSLFPAVLVLSGPHRAALDRARDLLDAQDYGMTFDNGKDTAIVVIDPKLPRQDFNVKF